MRLHPKEKLFYDAIFDFIRKERPITELAGPEIYPTLASSGLQRPVLTEIWKAANVQNRKGLSRSDLYVALRMISLVQHHGVTPEASALQEKIQNTATVKPPKLRPPVEFQQYYRQKQAAMKNGLANTTDNTPNRSSTPNPFVITELQRDSYLNFFQQLDVGKTGLISGPQAKTFLDKSGLPAAQLSKIWFLSDIDQDGQLDAQEFCVAMQLVMVVRKNLCPLPTTLPPSLNPKSGRTPGGSSPGLGPGMRTPGGPTPGGPSIGLGPGIRTPGGPTPGGPAPSGLPAPAQTILANPASGGDRRPSNSLFPAAPGLPRQVSNQSQMSQHSNQMVPERRISVGAAPPMLRNSSADSLMTPSMTNLFAPPDGTNRKHVNALRDQISKEFATNMQLKEQVLKQEELSAKSQMKLEELKHRLQAKRDKNNELRIQLKVEEERQEGNASQTKALHIEKADLERDTADVKAQISALRGRSTNSDDILGKLKHEVSVAKRRFDESKLELEALESESATLKSAEQEVKNSLDSLRQQEKDLRTKITNIRLASSELSMKQLNAEREMGTLTETVTKLKKEISIIEAQNETERQRIKILTESNNKKKKEIEALKEKRIAVIAAKPKAPVETEAPKLSPDDFATGFGDPFANIEAEPKQDNPTGATKTTKVATAAVATTAVALPATAVALNALSSQRSIGSDSSSGMEPPPLPPDPFPGEPDPFAQSQNAAVADNVDKKPPEDPFASTTANPGESDPEPMKSPPADPFATSETPPDAMAADPFADAASEKPPESADPFAQPKENLKFSDPFSAFPADDAPQAVAAATKPPIDDPFDSSFDPFASMDAAMENADPFGASEIPVVPTTEEEVEGADVSVSAVSFSAPDISAADVSADPFAGAEDPVAFDADEIDPFAGYDLDDEFPEEDFT